MRIKKSILAGTAGLALFVLPLAACGDDNPPPTPPAPTQQPNPPVPPQPGPGPTQQPGPGPYTSSEQSFLNLLYSASVTFTTYNESDLIGAGYYTCDLLDSGYSVDDAFLTLYNETPLTAYETGALGAAAANTLCPQYADDVEAWVLLNTPSGVL